MCNVRVLYYYYVCADSVPVSIPPGAMIYGYALTFYCNIHLVTDI